MQRIILALIFIIVVSTQQVDKFEALKLFAQFKQEYRKIYVDHQTDEEGTAEYGITQFSDLSVEEFKNTYLMPSRSPPTFSEDQYMGLNQMQNDPPASFDWKDQGAVTRVKDQGSVGTCWVFSTIGNIEGVWKIAGNPLTELSEEQVSDCDSTVDPDPKRFPNADCGVFGGWPYLAMQYVMRVGGLPSEADYPYCLGLGGKDDCYPCSPKGYNKTSCGPGLFPPSCNDTLYPCKQGKYQVAAKIDDWRAISTNETEIQQQLLNNGPLSVGLDAQMLQFYKRGIFAPKWCSNTKIDHAVLMTGYGVDGKPFWNVKNSWGPKWGENGYFRILRNNNQCGIATQVVTAIVNKKVIE